MNKTICAITTLLVLNGCATPPVTVMQEKITGDNFWKMAKVERLDKFFYSGRYVGKLSVCFPPASKIACPDNEDGRPAYEAIDELPMVAYAAQIQNSDLSERTKAKEFLHLILSDIALVKGYKSFAILKKTESSSCRTSYSTDTYGSVSSIGQQSASGQYSGIGQYSGTSNFRESTSCGFIDSISVVMFNDIYVLEKGVFSKDRQYGGNHFGIERSLYVGNPGVAFGDHNKVNNTYGRPAEPPPQRELRFKSSSDETRSAISPKFRALGLFRRPFSGLWRAFTRCADALIPEPPANFFAPSTDCSAQTASSAAPCF